MTPRKIMALSFALAAFATSGSFLSACAGNPDGERMVTYRETGSTEDYQIPSDEETDAPAACTPDDDCQSDANCETGFFCNTEECVCQAVTN